LGSEAVLGYGSIQQDRTGKEVFMKYMLAAFSVLLLVTLSLGQQQGGQPNSPPYGTPPTFPGSPQQPPSQMPPDHKAPPPRSMTTNEVEQQIQAHLNSEPALSATRIDVIAEETSVTLSGTVESERQHDLALRIARSYAGERQIVDKITIRQQT
jgi:hypothetical protein